MIITFIIRFVVMVFRGIFALFPTSSVSNPFGSETAPTWGIAISNGITIMIQTWNAFLISFPYAVVGWHMFLVILSFEALMLIGKFFLGARLPAHTN